MEKINITLDIDGKEFIGSLQQVAGAVSTGVYHLYDQKNFYIGRLRFTDHWIFDATPKSREFEKHAERFAAFLNN